MSSTITEEIKKELSWKVFTCKKHGVLTEKTAYWCKEPKAICGFRMRCEQCRHESRVIRYNRNREENIKYSINWKKENKEKVNKQIKADRIKNPEKYRIWEKNYKLRNREKINTDEICRRNGITIEYYRTMQEKQNNLCAICNLPETRKSRDSEKITRLCVDHDHDTNAVRELLCHHCNSGLGKFKDTPELLLAAADYLIKHKGTIIYDE